MHPEIVSFGPFAIRSYGFMLALGFLFGITFAARRAAKFGENPDHVYNVSIWIVASSLFGSRLYYVVSHYHEFSEEGLGFPVRFFAEMKNMFWPVGADGQVGINGLVLYGGIIAATIATVGYLKYHRLSIPQFLDILGPSVGLGEFFTRIGCFLNGCCFGKPTDSFVGVVFPEHSAAGYCYPHMHIHPAQLYSSFAGLAIFFGLLWLERYKKFDGFTAIMYFILYAIGRFIIDFFRHYETRMTFWGLSHNQLLSLGLVLVGSVLLVFCYIRTSSRENNPEI